jgi:hypothetical protein
MNNGRTRFGDVIAFVVAVIAVVIAVLVIFGALDGLGGGG